MFKLEEHRLLLWQKISQIKEDSQNNHEVILALPHIEQYWAYPGDEVVIKIAQYYHHQQFPLLSQLAKNVSNSLHDDSYRQQSFIPFSTPLSQLDKPKITEFKSFVKEQKKPYFEVLIIHPDRANYELYYRNTLANLKQLNEDFIYDILFVDTIQDAVIALLNNPIIQICIHLYGVPEKPSIPPWFSQSDTLSQLIEPSLSFYEFEDSKDPRDCVEIAKELIKLRKEIDHFFISDLEINTIKPEYFTVFNRIIGGYNLFQDLHYYIISSIRERYDTPFFNALRNYASKPKSPFHALPLSQGASISCSNWIKDFGDFYGKQLFDAETSSAQGGLDSLLDPKGAISQSQNKVAKTFRSQRSFFVTNGTSTTNKIVMQSNLCKDDLVMISSDCHKSIPYAVMLSGAHPIFIETYPLNHLDLYGGVSLERIKAIMLDLKEKQQLHRLKQITLTNITFDGIIYNVKKFMWQILAIKPDVIFHWDEAWFAYAYLHPLYHSKIAMDVANDIKNKLNTERYLIEYQQWKQANSKKKCFTINDKLLPDPNKVRLRVYATQSTHKSLSALRQASKLHIYDEDFNQSHFTEAYYMHTSTSPNYQIIASLDIARRQANLEGFEMVQKSLYLANKLRDAITNSDHLSHLFKVLDDTDLVPKSYRTEIVKNKATHYCQTHWEESDFVVDPTRVTIDIRNTGLSGSQFRELLINQYDIQVNKTSRYTVLFIINIGVTEKSIEYLLNVMHQIAMRLHQKKALQATENLHAETPLDLPQKRQYHKKYIACEGSDYQAGELQQAYSDSMQEDRVCYEPLTNELIKHVMNDLKLVSAAYVTPYPPGFPVLVPGQIISYDILIYLQKTHIKEIHGYQPQHGLKVFKATFIHQ